MTDNSEKNNQDNENLQQNNAKPEDAKEISIEEKLKNTEDKLLRSLAEVENQRRRFEKDVKEAFDFGGFNFAKESLTILDNLQRAKISIKNDEKLKDNQDLDKFLKNIDIIEKDLVSIFEKNNIKKITSINQKFDPNIHQAMLEVEDEKSEVGTIVQEIQPGYMFKDRLLRPSFVGVSKKKVQKEEKNEQKKEN
ncbi:MAG: nucleotide exchange factor GrpE [Pelagibacteraceae bacterium]